jgi:hypothetical protein
MFPLILSTFIWKINIYDLNSTKAIPKLLAFGDIVNANGRLFYIFTIRGILDMVMENG